MPTQLCFQKHPFNVSVDATCRQDTCFFFSCGTSALPGALERFGAFFRAPLFTESATEREATAGGCRRRRLKRGL